MDERYLPRPALGRRPWFAFLRRARSRRRFDLAMARKGNSSRVLTTTRWNLAGTDWESPELRVARSFVARIRGDVGPYGLLLRARSIVGLGPGRSVAFTAIDEAGIVLRTGVLRRRRAVWCRRARWFLELPPYEVLPEVGTRLRLNSLG